MITLSPETEADIRELLRLWGWDAGDQALLDAAASGCLIRGVSESLEITRFIASGGREGKWLPTVPQIIPDARAFEEGKEPDFILHDGTEFQNSLGERFVWRGGQWNAVEGGGK